MGSGFEMSLLMARSLLLWALYLQSRNVSRIYLLKSLEDEPISFRPNATGPSLWKPKDNLTNYGLSTPYKHEVQIQGIKAIHIESWSRQTRVVEICMRLVTFSRLDLSGVTSLYLELHLRDPKENEGTKNRDCYGSRG